MYKVGEEERMELRGEEGEIWKRGEDEERERKRK